MVELIDFVSNEDAVILLNYCVVRCGIQYYCQSMLGSRQSSLGVSARVAYRDGNLELVPSQTAIPLTIGLPLPSVVAVTCG